MKVCKIDLTNLKQIVKSNEGILCLLIIFTIFYTFNLDKDPAIWTDESWFSNPAYNLAFNGFFGTTMMPNFYNIAHFTYWQMPFYMVLIACSFKLFGFGIIQARIISVILGFFTVLFTYLLGTELYNRKIGLLASILLIINPLFFLIAREVRMDIAVTCFTLVALYLLIKALKNGKSIYYFGTGVFAMLSILSHPNGLFGAFCVILIYFICKTDFKNFKIKFKLRELLCMILGPILLLIPYLYYISLDFTDFIGQFKSNIISSANDPLTNFISESIRYLWTFNLFTSIEGYLGILAVLILIYLTIFGLFHIFKNRNEFGGKFLIIVLLVHLFLLTFLVHRKESIWYLGSILPYLSILIVLPVREKINYKKGIQMFILLFLSLFVIVNVFGIGNTLYISNNYNYHAINYEVNKYVPNGSIVIGDASYWFALHDNYTYYNYYNYSMSVSTFKQLHVAYILYDNGYYWTNNLGFADIDSYLHNNCTFIKGIQFTNVGISKIEIYKVNYP